MRVLVVGTDADSARRLEHDFRRHGHELQIADSVAAVLDRCRWAEVVLLDTDLEQTDTFALCRDLRRRVDNRSIIIMLSEKTAEIDCILGLQAGCDDYLTRPYGFYELMARIEAVARRVRQAESTQGMITHGRLHIDLSSFRVRVEDRDVAVTPKEFRLLYVLMSRYGEVVSRKQIMKEVWDADLRKSNSRTIDTHVNTLRRKLGAGQWITTVRGVGFKMESRGPKTS